MPIEALSLQLNGLSLGGQPVLGTVAMSLMRNETLAITGPSGVGKTTLLRVLAGSIPGAQMRSTGRIAMMFQEPRLLPWRSALDNLIIATGVSPARARDLLSEVGLAHKANHFPAQLSLGQQRRVALARALGTEPDVLLLDEPFVSLDAATTAQMRDLFLKLKSARELATVLVSHDPDDIEALADRVVTLSGHPARLDH